MGENEKQTSGVIGSARRVADTLLSLLRNRVELFALELQEEKYRFVAILVWLGVLLFSSFVALIVVTLTVVAFTPEETRPFVMLFFSILYLAVAVASGLMLRRKLKTGAPPLAESISELKKDLTWLRSRD